MYMLAIMLQICNNVVHLGMETSFGTLAQALLVLLQEPAIVKRLQAEIDSQFEPTHTITIKDRCSK